jgi:RNA polymerase sigma factor (sigma-70 family)
MGIPPLRDDELLAIQCQLGEPEALDELVARWHPALQRYVRSLLPTDNQASDVLQDVWIGILRGLARLREPASLVPWMFGIARRTVMTRLRVKYAAAEVPIADLDVPSTDAPDREWDKEVEWASVEQALARMPVVERDVLVLFHLQELSLRDLSQVLDVPEGTVKSRLHRARRQLRTLMTEEKP